MTESPAWMKIKPKEIEDKVVDLAKQGTSSEKIGLILRDQHGIPRAKVLGKRISHILREAKIESHSEEKNIKNKIENIEKHFSKNKNDKNAQRSLMKHQSRIRKFNN